MSVKVSLQAVVDELDALMEGCVAYVNAKTGELISLSEDDRMLAEQQVDPEEEIPKWQQEALPKIRDVLESEDYLELPSKFDIHEYAIMENFCYSIDDPRLRSELLNAIRGSGAFSRFKSVIHSRKIQNAWYAFKQAALERIAIDWLEDKGIPYTTEGKRRSP
jgi:Uncharacterised protein family (UPF0158)